MASKTLPRFAPDLGLMSGALRLSSATMEDTLSRRVVKMMTRPPVFLRR